MVGIETIDTRNRDVNCPNDISFRKYLRSLKINKKSRS
jgi:hypothetical protein